MSDKPTVGAAMLQKRYLYIGGVRDGLFESFTGSPQYSRAVMAGTKEQVTAIDMIGRGYTANMEIITQDYRLVRERGSLRVENTETYLMVLDKDQQKELKKLLKQQDRMVPKGRF
jgi:hypothetical protein